MAHYVENECDMKMGSIIVNLQRGFFFIRKIFFCNKTCDLFKIT